MKLISISPGFNLIFIFCLEGINEVMDKVHMVCIAHHRNCCAISDRGTFHNCITDPRFLALVDCSYKL